MDIKQKLENQYDNIAIYTAGFYADPEDELGTRSKLMETLKSFVMNQHADVPFSLQMMLTNGEINIMPLGLLSLDELKAYENEQRRQRGLKGDNGQIPMVVQFAPHVEKAEIRKQIIGTTDDLFNNFKSTFATIWEVVKADLSANQQLLTNIETDLVADSTDVKKEYQVTFSKLTPQQLQDKLGFNIKENDLDHFSTFMADMHEIQAIVMSAAAFTTKEVIADNLFAQVMVDDVRRGTFFWVLDNTFYEILYYFIKKYGATGNGGTITKHLHHQKKLLIINMRNAAYQNVQTILANPKKAADMTHYFSDLFIPVAEQLAAEVDKFSI